MNIASAPRFSILLGIVLIKEILDKIQDFLNGLGILRSQHHDTETHINFGFERVPTFFPPKETPFSFGLENAS